MKKNKKLLLIPIIILSLLTIACLNNPVSEEQLQSKIDRLKDQNEELGKESIKAQKAHKDKEDELRAAKLELQEFKMINNELTEKESEEIEKEILRLGGECKYRTPHSLFYTFLKCEGYYDEPQANIYISQSFKAHVANDGFRAIDVGTRYRPLTQYAPDIHNKEIEWKVEHCDWRKSTGKCLILIQENKFKILIGHVREYLVEDGSTVKTGEPIMITGGTETYKKGGDEGASTGYHAHYEYFMWSESKLNEEGKLGDWVEISYTNKSFDRHEEYNKRKDAEEKKKEDMIKEGYIKFTTYNAEVGQTDADPCNGRAGNVCELYKQGKNPIALSRDLIQAETEFDKNNGYCVENCKFRYGDIVTVIPKDHFQGQFEAVIVDTMNKRYTNRGDIFKDDRSKNTSFYASIHKVNL